MITRRNVLRFFAATSLTTSTSSLAQHAGKIPRVGMLALNSGELLQPVRDGLRALSYIEGKNIHLEERAVGDNYERLSQTAREFVSIPVDVIVTAGSTATRAAQKATSTIPIVMITGIDPVQAGYAASLARPGSNLTGLMYSDLQPKRMELAKELVPNITRIGVLINPASAGTLSAINTAQSGAKQLKLQLQIFEVHANDEFESVFAKISRSTVQMIVVPPQSMLNANQKRIIDVAAKYKIGCIYGSKQWVESGGLASYGADITEARKEAARYIDRILRGAKPADIPIEQPTHLELALNLKTAQNLGLRVPDAVLLRAGTIIR